MKDRIIVEQASFQGINHCNEPITYEKNMGIGELSTWVARQLVSGHVQQAEKIKIFHRRELKRIVDYMLDVLGERTNYVEMFEVMHYAISALGYDKKDLTTITSEQYSKIRKTFPYYRRK